MKTDLNIMGKNNRVNKQNQSCGFEKIDKIDKLLATLMKKKREKYQEFKKWDSFTDPQISK